MDRRVVPFKAHHYEWLIGRGDAAEGVGEIMQPGLLLQLERQNSWTGVIDGVPLVCAGTIQQWPGRHTAWAWVARGTLKHLEWITAETLKRIKMVAGRIECTVRADFPAGQRWMRSLGFKIETPLMPKYGPQGEDHVGYVRFN